MASRLALGLVPVHSGRLPVFGEQKLFMNKAVDRHMRIVTHVSSDATMHVTSPSEPVLAIAASLIMLPTAKDEKVHVLGKWQKAVNVYRSILEHFRKRCLIGPAIALFKDAHGELASRVVLMAAWDSAKRKILDGLEHCSSQESKPPPTTSDYARIVSQAVPLDSILAGLADLDQANLDQLRQHLSKVYKSGSSTRPALQATVGKPMLWVNYTHFDVLPNEITEITAEYLWYCWKRGVALQMAHLQGGIDGIIPVFVGSLQEPFITSEISNTNIEIHAARYMTYVAWEAKNRSDPQPNVTLGDLHKTLKLAGPRIICATPAPPGEQLLTDRALLNVLLGLGTSTPFAAKPRSLQPWLQMIANTQCLRLCIRGALDPHAYPCLDVLKIRSVFQDLLADIIALPSFEHLNVMPSPIWKNNVRPSLHLVSDAQVLAPAQSDLEEHVMDMD
ncbi:uncharacterized protein MEPE_04348 [Melanopsichium pennsylvanicum]|uniref:Uncharacterized protein n=1 Tax=Melanopsichium pennsylvanicum TaxID=63383 RepID=A0AAJ4XNL0_9BASI|nr:uncharacterized protein MEPE_04348 [Melanopsichium pennsylvanicum]